MKIRVLPSLQLPPVASRKTSLLGALVAIASLSSAAYALPPLAPVNLGSAAKFAVLAGSLVSNAPGSAITGDIGLSPAAGSKITGFGANGSVADAKASTR